MNCAQACPLLGDHLEGDLALPVRAEMDEHLNHCSACRQELRELRSTIALVRSLPTPEPPPWLASAVMEQIGSRTNPSVRFRRVLDPRVAAALAAGIAGLVLFATMDAGDEATQRIALWPGTFAEDTPAPTAGPAVNPTRQVAEHIDRRFWDEQPVTLARTARFRVEPRLTSTERNLAIRLRSNHRATGGFYGRVDPDPQFLDLDAQIDRAKSQPEAFLAEVANADEADRQTFIAPFAARAARRGDAQVVAGQLRRVSHPQARSAAELFEQSWRQAHTQSDQSTYSR